MIAGGRRRGPGGAVVVGAVLAAAVSTVTARPLCSQVARGADSTIAVTVRVESAGTPVEHAVVRVDAAGTETNAAGLARLRVVAGPHRVRVARLGYLPDSLDAILARDTLVVFELRDAAEELESVVVTSTRGARRIEDEPQRVEVLAGEDVAEKTEMRPSDITGFLSEMAGVRVQRTAASTGTAGVRLQGLRSRYTLLLADGLPLYGGSGGGGLDLLQLPPADLRQIEVVKGPASALYGASALGGMINLVSKRPAHEADLLVHGTGERGGNAFGWISRKLTDHTGVTAIAGAHAQSRRDMDADGWSDIPGFARVEARPRLFYEGSSGRSVFVTAGATVENREGGTAPGGITPAGTEYVEAVDTRRGDVGVVGQRLVGRAGLLQLRASGNADGKSKSFGGDPEHVTRGTGFAELSLAASRGVHDLLAGASAEVDGARIEEYSPLDYTFGTGSAFAQDVWRIAPRLALTASGRVDAHSRYGTHASPRVSLLVRLAEDWTARASGTHGFYAPTPFVEESEAIGVRRVRGFDALRAEEAAYGALDVNGKAGPIEVNATVFASRLTHAVRAETPATEPTTLHLANAVGPTRTSGLELFGVYNLKPLLVTALYTLTEATEPATATAPSPRRRVSYTPRHTGGIDVTWEGADTWIALEGFYTGRQALEDDPYRATGKPYTVVGFLATQRFGPAKVFVGVENVTDIRQSRYDPIFLPARRPDGRWTTTPWAPLEGRVVSAGVRFSEGR